MLSFNPFPVSLAVILTSIAILKGTFMLLRLTSPHLQFYCFLAFAGLTISICFAYSLLAHPIFYLLGRHDLAQYTTSCLFWYITAPIVGLRLDIEGEAHLKGWGGKKTSGGKGKGPCIFVANHQSELDVLLMAELWQPHTVACATWRVRFMPLFGLYCRLCRTVFVDPPRSSGLTNKGILLEAARMIRHEGMNLWIYPEGVRSYATKPELLPLKRGAVAVALVAGNIPLVPVVVGNAAHVFDMPGRAFRPGTINVRVLDHISMELRMGEDRDGAISRVLAEMREVMLESLKEISS